MKSSLACKTSILKIDKDCIVSRSWNERYIDRVVIPICHSYGTNVKLIKVCASRSKGQHFYIYVDPPVNAETANEMQYQLGDDCQRVDFNRARIDSGLEEWNKLFEESNRRLRTIYRVEVFLHDFLKP